MGILRVILALSVVVAHVGSLFGLEFFGGGVMGVETFYMLSGFYMALVLSTRYRDHTRDFYFNRFLRLFPAYWLLVIAFFLLSSVYWLAVGHPLGALAAWRAGPSFLHCVWGGFSNLAIVGSDWAELYSALTTADSNSVNRLIAIQPAWSLAVEITFYLGAPFLLRLGKGTQWIVFFAALAIRIGLWLATGSHWSVWIYYFAPATWVFFLGGVQAYHVMVWLEKKDWFTRTAIPTGRVLTVLLVLLIVSYQQIDLLRFQDWRYYTLIGLSLPFVFTAFKASRFDAALAAWSYPVYLAHWVIRTMRPTFRHFAPPSANIYLILGLTLILSYLVMQADTKIQRHFKRAV